MTTRPLRRPRPLPRPLKLLRLSSLTGIAFKHRSRLRPLIQTLSRPLQHGCRTGLLALIVGASLPLAAVAQPAAPATTAAAVKPSATANASAAIKAAVEGTVAAIRNDPVAKGGDPARTAQLVTSHFLPYTDFRRTARLATGDAWKTATPQQQDQIATQFQALLVTVYAAQLTQIQGQNIQFQFDAPVAAPGSSDVVIGSKVHTSTDDLTTRYRLEKTPEGYKVYDIDLMGIWLIQVYRQQFANQLNQGGIDGLIKFLTAHNARGAG